MALAAQSKSTRKTQAKIKGKFEKKDYFPGILFLLLLLFGYFVIPSLNLYTKYVYVVSTLPNSPANGTIVPGSVILNWGGYNISTVSGLKLFLNKSLPFSEQQLVTNHGNYTLISNATGKIGVLLAQGINYNSSPVALLILIIYSIFVVATLVYSIIVYRRYLTHRKIRYFLYLLGFQVLALMLIPILPVPHVYSYNSTYNYSQTVSTQTQSNTPIAFLIAWGSIFVHNLIIATLEVIPFLGILYFGVETFVTALAINLAESGSLPAVGALLLTFPYGWIELSAYAFAAAEGLALLKALFEHNFKRELIKGVKIWGFATMLLLLAALFEATTIFSAAYLGLLYAYLTWIPFAILLLIAIKIKIFDREWDL